MSEHHKETALLEIKARPNKYLVKWLEELLAEAKAGTLQSMVIACLHAEGKVSNGWTGIYNRVAAYTLIGQIEKVKAVILEPIVTQEAAEDD